MHQATGSEMGDLSEIRFVKRIAVRKGHGDRPAADDQDARAMDLLNRCLAEFPKGRIITIEKHTSMEQIGAEQVSVEWVCYHVGFPRRPAWLVDMD
ncbi:hypothetical protein LL965_08230 [Xanthomonas cassavae CFBP 4642]|uniref:Uncharacterized protein n=1 Tax=Xanthomonas cassavae CFBP 4642 TaxID=1219375 RepID=A0ABS8HD34_9XANT|nr:hypothetical protein [Xanthomonas cassavae]MCC4620075.1 hypothetical protein [Xanthomonas cassavae CFBP 4642]